MASTYTSRLIIPGRRAGNIKQIVNDRYQNNHDCVCPSPINNKIIVNSNPDVIPISTQANRAVNAIKYARGGRVVFGNAPYYSTISANLVDPPIRNKF